MAERIKIEIDASQLDALLARLNVDSTGKPVTGGGTLGGIGRGPSSSGGTSVSAKGPRTNGLVADIFFSPAKAGGSLPSIGRGTRTLAGIAGGQAGYGLVEQYQKGLWLEQAFTAPTAAAALTGIFTFVSLLVMEVQNIKVATDRLVAEQKRYLMEISDIHNLKAYTAWETLQKEQYRGRKE